jgi:hypothetical protein
VISPPGGPAGDDHAASSASPAVVAGLVRLATIVATVELERALAGLGRSAAAALDDPLLGAAVVLVDDPIAGRLAVAEPTTEGRLAATLARHGEGPCGQYLSLPDPPTADALDAFRRRATAEGVAISRVESGPFGPSVLVLSGPVTGPHLIVAGFRPLPSGS